MRIAEPMSYRDALCTPLKPAPIANQTMAPMPQSNHQERTRNELRPSMLHEMVGQERLRGLLRRVIDASAATPDPLDHMLLVGPSGTGKSTIANIVANELAARVFQVEAPVSHSTLMDLRTEMVDGDVLFVDEIHMQAVQERRGKDSSTQPEVLFTIMEDRTIVTSNGVLPYPSITLIGATTDEGMLPDPFINRFPLRPVIASYSESDLTALAKNNADALGLTIDHNAAVIFARACRGTPRVLNNYVKNARSLAGADRRVTAEAAREVLEDLNGTTPDGLTRDMQALLVFLRTRARRVKGDGEETFQASVGSIATAIGKSRDVKAVQLRIEPYLITEGYLAVGHGGRMLTDAGIVRAEELL